MDVPAHILDAVQTASDPQSRRASTRPSASSASSRHRSRPRFVRPLSAKSSYDDLSARASDDDDDSEREERGYTTSLTSPSEASHEDGGGPAAAESSTMLCGAPAAEGVEAFRDREYPQLKGKVYLDHGGTTLYARSLIEEFSADLIANLYGNPHSASTPSAIAGHRVDAVRERALRFFGADPEHFDLVFVANATAAIKLVIDCFKDYAATTNTPVWYGYHRDAHTSLVGVRETTKMHRCFTSDDEVDIWIKSGGFGGPRARQLGLFAYPGQSNMTGRRLPASWPGSIRKQFHRAATYTLLDAAALASTAPLDLSDPATAPDFVALSFYKIFGFPNVGALIVRKDSAHVLQHRRYFGGGTVEMIITVADAWHAKKDTSVHDRLEDGTLPFHSIFALDHAMTVHERLYGPDPMKAISAHTATLGKQLYHSLAGLTHANGRPLAKIYKDANATYGDPTSQGATIAFNVLRPDGSLVGYAEVEEAADQRSIFVRSGSLCNPGGIATYLEWSPAEMRAAYNAGHRCSNPTQIMLGRPTGVVRVSLGAMTTAADVRALVRFLEETYVDRSLAVVGTARPHSTAVHQALQLAAATGLHASGAASLPLTPISPNPPTLPPPVSLDSPASTLLPSIASDDTITPATSGPATEPPERPRFIPADHLKHRRPWEEELRKGHWATPSTTTTTTTTQPQPLDFRNYPYNANSHSKDDDATTTHTSRHPTPSLKARKFGRSMVNLLRARDKAAGGAGSPGLPGGGGGVPPAAAATAAEA